MSNMSPSALCDTMILYHHHITTRSPVKHVQQVTKCTMWHYDIIPSRQLADFRPLQGYLVGEEKKTSISLRNYVLDHWVCSNKTPRRHENEYLHILRWVIQITNMVLIEILTQHNFPHVKKFNHWLFMQRS